MVQSVKIFSMLVNFHEAVGLGKTTGPDGIQKHIIRVMKMLKILFRKGEILMKWAFLGNNERKQGIQKQVT